MTHADSHASAPEESRRHACEACGATFETLATPLFEIPVPPSVAEALGLGPAPAAVARVLCQACVSRGAGHRPMTLPELVDLAPPAVKQAIHERLIHEFEI